MPGPARATSELAAQVAERSGGNPLFAEEIVNRLIEEGGRDTESLPDTVHSVLAARLDALSRPERRVLQHASVVGESFWVGSLASVAEAEGLDLGADARRSSRTRTWSSRSPAAGSPASASTPSSTRWFATSPTRPCRRRSGPESTPRSGEFIAERAADRSEGVIATVAEHLGRAATLGAAADLEPGELERIDARALAALEAAGDLAAALYSNREAVGHYEAALRLRRGRAGRRARIEEKLGDVALRLGRVDARDRRLGARDGASTAARSRWPGSATCIERSARGSGTRAIARGRSSTTSRGIDLLKDGPPSIELVRLYEEAASLYMHTGDNMLAIYASEKALRLAERLGEAAAASRAHGIFGRVFGRIGDAKRARENLERSVELARESDPAEAVRALLALGYHLEVSETDYEGAAAAYGEGLELSVEIGDLPSQVELHAPLGGLAVQRGDLEAAERATEAARELAEREGLVGKLCFPYSLRGILECHAGELEAATDSLERAFELAEQVGRSEIAFQSLFWLAAAQRDLGAHADADQSLARALDLCERAGLIAQSLEATAARAVNLALAGKAEQAREVAADAQSLADRLGYPVGKAAALEAGGAAAADPVERSRLLELAAAAWAELRRPLDAERCERLAGSWRA